MCPYNCIIANYGTQQHSDLYEDCYQYYSRHEHAAMLSSAMAKFNADSPQPHEGKKK